MHAVAIEQVQVAHWLRSVRTLIYVVKSSIF